MIQTQEGKWLTVGVSGVTKLTGSVPDQVQRPTEKLVHGHVEELVNGGILNSLSELSLSESRYADISMDNVAAD